MAGLTSNSTKYVVIQTSESGEQAVVFNPHMSHDTFKNLSPISAGFFHVRENKVVLSSEMSWSLNKGPRPEDRDLIRQAMGIPAL